VDFNRCLQTLIKTKIRPARSTRGTRRGTNVVNDNTKQLHVRKEICPKETFTITKVKGLGEGGVKNQEGMDPADLRSLFGGKQISRWDERN